ncbi:MAG: Cof-type HAD-IIB family hydrolase [Clostridia bacterium]
MKYKAIFCDFDGTLYRDDFTISQQDKSAIHKYIANGGKFVIATGRLFRSIKLHLNALELFDGEVIVRQGGGIYDIASEKELYGYTFDSQLSLAAAKYLDSLENAFVGFYYDDKCFTTCKSEYFDLFAKICAIDYTPLNMNLEEYFSTTGILPTKLIVLSTESGTETIARNGEKLFGDKIDFAKSGKTILELMPKDINKGKAVAQICKECGLDKEEIICIGDSENDISMISYGGLGVAVANAFDKTKECADFIAKDCNDNAVTQIIEKFCFKEQKI